MLVFVKDYDVEIDVIDLHLNIYTAPAFMGTLLGVLALVALLIWFKEGKNTKSQESVNEGKIFLFQFASVEGALRIINTFFCTASSMICCVEISFTSLLYLV